MPAAAARRRHIRQASGWPIGGFVSTVALWSRLVRNSQPSSSIHSDTPFAVSTRYPTRPRRNPSTTSIARMIPPNTICRTASGHCSTDSTDSSSVMNSAPANVPA